MLKYSYVNKGEVFVKLVLAIVNDEDGSRVMDELSKNGFMATKMCSSGGFLKVGNTTLLVGVDQTRVEQVLKIVEAKSRGRKQTVSSAISPASSASDSMYMSYPVEISVGGATVFVVDVEQFQKF